MDQNLDFRDWDDVLTHFQERFLNEKSNKAVQSPKMDRRRSRLFMMPNAVGAYNGIIGTPFAEFRKHVKELCKPRALAGREWGPEVMASAILQNEDIEFPQDKIEVFVMVDTLANVMGKFDLIVGLHEDARRRHYRFSLPPEFLSDLEECVQTLEILGFRREALGDALASERRMETYRERMRLIPESSLEKAKSCICGELLPPDRREPPAATAEDSPNL